MKTLILYATTEGQTRKIARYMAEVLEENQHEVDVCDVTDNPPSPAAYDAIFIGASIHAGKYQEPVKHYIKENVEALNKKNSSFFSVCLAVASADEEDMQEVNQIVDHFVKGIAWQPKHVMHVAGALKYTQYNWLIKLVMKNIAKKQGGSVDTQHDHEYTDWEQLKKDTLACLY